MYAQFFGLKQAPFSIAPDPRYLFMSERHREALAHLLYGVRAGGGFVLLTGEIGAGKTTVCRCFLEQIPKRCNVAYIFNPKLTVEELLQSICHEFRIPPPQGSAGRPTVKDYVDALNAYLLDTHAVGQNNVLIIDEAQNLSADVLEQLRLLTNLETHERKLLQIILIGQPELRHMLARPELEQLAQRVIARFHLQALSENETAQYVRHRLAVAGMRRALPFDRAALKRIHALARGVPRRINLLCDRALLGAYAHGQARVDRQIVDTAAHQVFDAAPPAPPRRGQRRRAAWAAAFALAVVLGIAAIVAMTGDAPRRPKAAAATPAPAGSAPATPAASAPAVAAAPAASAAVAPQPFALASGFDRLARDESEAWQVLAERWALAPGEDDPCAAASRQQVHCFRASGSLALLRKLDRPALLTLSDAEGRSAYAVLTGLDGERATLRVGDADQPVPLSELEAAWHGEFATLWRAPDGYGTAISEPDTGAASQWVARQLAALQGPPPASGPPPSLKSRVTAFQTVHGLRPDGLAGPLTLMHLNRLAGVDEPRLQPRR